MAGGAPPATATVKRNIRSHFGSGLALCEALRSHFFCEPQRSSFVAIAMASPLERSRRAAHGLPYTCNGLAKKSRVLYGPGNLPIWGSERPRVPGRPFLESAFRDIGALPIGRFTNVGGPRLNYVARYSPLHVCQKEPKPIVIASFGYETNYGKDFLKKIQYEDWVTIDVRDWLHGDPAAKVKHGENGACAQTQKAVFGQEGYFECLSSIMDTILDGHNAIALGCKAGLRRSDTLMRHSKDLLNMVKDIVHQCSIYSAASLVPRPRTLPLFQTTLRWPFEATAGWGGMGRGMGQGSRLKKSEHRRMLTATGCTTRSATAHRRRTRGGP